jgi:hypothetical protein
MTALSPRLPIVLAVKPIHRGFGWVAFEGPFVPYDWGIAEPSNKGVAGAVAAFEKLIERLKPETLLLEAFEHSPGDALSRALRINTAMASHAIGKGLFVEVYTRVDVQACFSAVGARTRPEIAAAVAKHLDAFRHRLPRQRRIWESEDRRMALFAAVALVLTHYQRGADDVFDDVRRAA